MRIGEGEGAFHFFLGENHAGEIRLLQPLDQHARRRFIVIGDVEERAARVARDQNVPPGSAGQFFVARNPAFCMSAGKSFARSMVENP